MELGSAATNLRLCCSRKLTPGACFVLHFRQPSDRDPFAAALIISSSSHVSLIHSDLDDCCSMSTSFLTVTQPTTAANSASSLSLPRLYRHVLESIFAFCTLGELAHVCAVAQDCCAAVASMLPIAGSIDGRRLNRVRSQESILARHVRYLSHFTITSSSKMQQCVRTFSGLRHLQLALAGDDESSSLLSAASVEALPAGLRSLTLACSNFIGRLMHVHAPCQSWIDAVGQCSHLHTLQLRDFPLCGITSLAPLLLLSRTPDSPLRHLRFQLDERSEGTEWTAAHIATLRAMVSLQTLEVAALPQPLIDALLATPHSLRWRTFECVEGLDSRDWSALQHVPTLTRLRIDASVIAEVDFLARMPSLLDLSLRQYLEPSDRAEQDRARSAVAACSQLRRLELDGAFGSHAFGQLLSQLPHLRSLSVEGFIDSLSFLPTDPLPRRLLELRIVERNRLLLPTAELHFLDSLCSLETLCLHSPLRTSADREEVLAQLQPPSALIPSLRSFSSQQGRSPQEEHWLRCCADDSGERYQELDPHLLRD